MAGLTAEFWNRIYMPWMDTEERDKGICRWRAMPWPQLPY